MRAMPGICVSTCLSIAKAMYVTRFCYVSTATESYMSSVLLSPFSVDVDKRSQITVSSQHVGRAEYYSFVLVVPQSVDEESRKSVAWFAGVSVNSPPPPL